MHIISVSGPVVTAAGHGDQLAIVTHASDCLPSGDQVFVGMPVCIRLTDALILIDHSCCDQGFVKFIVAYLSYFCMCITV
jgi:hypothetical protein